MDADRRARPRLRHAARRRTNGRPAPLIAAQSRGRPAARRPGTFVRGGTAQRLALAGLVLAVLLILFGAAAAWQARGVADDLQAARVELLRVLDTGRAAGIALTDAEADEISRGLASADASLARAIEQLDGPVLLAARVVPIAGTQLTAADTLATGIREVTRQADTVAILLDGLLAARDGGEGAERLANLARFVGAYRTELEAVLDAVVAFDGTVRELPPDGLIGPLASTRATLVQQLETVGPLAVAARQGVAVVPEVMGVGGERRYLTMALDNAEIRPIGGLIAAFATPRFTDGRFQDYAFRDVLEVDLADQPVYVRPPDPVIDHLLGDETPWQVADAGWWPDFADSAVEARRLFEIETGDADFDGAIAFTPEFVDALLEIVGPVDVPEAGIVHPGETYLVSLEQVEILNQGEGRKQFLADLASEVLDRLFALPPERYPEVLATLDEAGKRRHLQVHVDDPTAQAWITELGWYTPFAFEDGVDRLSIMEANVAPVSKLNVLLDMEHRLRVELLDDGSAEEELITSFTNGFAPVLPPELERVRSAFFSGELGSFHRRYLHPDAEIIQVSSDDPELPITDPGYVDEEPGGLSVGNYQLIRPGTVRLATRYWVPAVVEGEDPARAGTYRLDFFKQPGRDDDVLTVEVTVPAGTVPVRWSDGGEASDTAVTFTWRTDFDRHIVVEYAAAP